MGHHKTCSMTNTDTCSFVSISLDILVQKCGFVFYGFFLKGRRLGWGLVWGFLGECSVLVFKRHTLENLFLTKTDLVHDENCNVTQERFRHCIILSILSHNPHRDISTLHQPGEHLAPYALLTLN